MALFLNSAPKDAPDINSTNMYSYISNRSIRMKHTLQIALMLIGISITGCATTPTHKGSASELQQELEDFSANCGAEIGIAVILNDTDTVEVNGNHNFPMNSVMKLFQAVAVAQRIHDDGKTVDSVLHISPDEMHPLTYSPMREIYKDHAVIDISISELLEYSLQQSDNNACDILFDHIISPASTQNAIQNLGIDAFGIAAYERTMYDNNSAAYLNFCQPIAAAALINRLYTDTIVHPDLKEFLTTTLNGCSTGLRRLPNAFEGTGAVVGHKTGTGFDSSDGLPQGINDVGFVQMQRSEGHAAIAVFIETSPFPIERTEQIICDVGNIVKAYLM